MELTLLLLWCYLIILSSLCCILIAANDPSIDDCGHVIGI